MNSLREDCGGALDPSSDELSEQNIAGSNHQDGALKETVKRSSSPAAAAAAAATETSSPSSPLIDIESPADVPGMNACKSEGETLAETPSSFPADSPAGTLPPTKSSVLEVREKKATVLCPISPNVALPQSKLRSQGTENQQNVEQHPMLADLEAIAQRLSQGYSCCDSGSTRDLGGATGYDPAVSKGKEAENDAALEREVCSKSEQQLAPKGKGKGKGKGKLVETNLESTPLLSRDSKELSGRLPRYRPSCLSPRGVGTQDRTIVTVASVYGAPVVGAAPVRCWRGDRARELASGRRIAAEDVRCALGELAHVLSSSWSSSPASTSAKAGDEAQDAGKARSGEGRRGEQRLEALPNPRNFEEISILGVTKMYRIRCL